MDRAVGEGLGERLVDESVLLDERESIEAAAGDRHLKVVAPAGPVLDGERAGVGERVAEEPFERGGHDHGTIVAVPCCKYLVRVKRLLMGMATLAALGAAAPAHASTPMPWCGTDSSAVDRQPDATPGYAVHVAYVRPPGGPDRFRELAPRIVGDAAAIEAWWRSQDAARSPRFDLFPVACATAFGALDITNVELPQAITGISAAFNQIRLLLASEAGFNESEKVYLIYYDGPTGQSGFERVCGQGAPAGGFGRPGVAIVYLDSCRATASDSLRPVVGVHELIHVLGAVADAAPNSCDDGHVCDLEADLMTSTLSGNELETHVLDSGRDDYYGHSGSWTDIQDSLFFERLDSPDRIPPTAPGALVVRDDPSGFVAVSWAASTDDVGPVAYRVYENGRFVREVARTSALLIPPPPGDTGSYSVRAADAVGHLSQPVTVRFKLGFGIVDEQGRLLRDTARPPAIRTVAVRRTTRTVVLSWPAVRDPGGIRGYRVRIGARTLSVTKPAVTITRASLRTAVSVAAVDRAGNVGPTTTVPLRRLR